MKTIRSLLAATVILTGGALAAAPVLAAEDTSTKTKVETRVDEKAEGGYEQQKKVTTETNAPDGTMVKEESKVHAEQDPDGSMKKNVETKTTTDPEGLMNETTTHVKDTEEVKDGKKTVKHMKKIDGKTVEETTTETGAGATIKNTPLKR